MSIRLPFMLDIEGFTVEEQLEHIKLFFHELCDRIGYSYSGNGLKIIGDNLQIDNEYIQDIIALFLQTNKDAGTQTDWGNAPIILTYDDTNNKLYISVDKEPLQDMIEAFLVAGNALTKTYDDTANTLTLDVDKATASSDASASSVSVTSADATDVTSADATDLPTVITLANEMKGDVNIGVTLINEMKSDINQLVTDINAIKTSLNDLKAKLRTAGFLMT